MNNQMIINPNHPILTHYLSIIRDKSTPASLFRRAADQISSLLITYATESLPTIDVEVETPLVNTIQKQVGSDIIIAPILRAGLAMVDPFLRMWPDAQVFHIGMRRNEETHIAETYYNNIQSSSKSTQSEVFILDPMLATGGSIDHACEFFKEKGYQKLHIIAMIAAPEGVKRVQNNHPEVRITIGAIDECLNENAYIVPGLGDAGDRYFGTI